MPFGGFIAIAPHLRSHTPKHTEIVVSYVGPTFYRLFA